MLTRREVLTAFLGAAVACRAKPEAPLPPGEIVGTADEIGHRLRGGSLPRPSRWEQRDVVVVGAGIAGLAAAWRLTEAGMKPLVLELEPAAGGTSRSGASRVSAFPWGAHYVPAPARENRVLIRLLNEIGAMQGGEPAEEALCRDPQERLWWRGRWYEGLYLYAGASHEDLRQLGAFEAEIAKWAGWRDARGRRAFTIPVSHCSDDADVTALDASSMAEWLGERRFTSPRLRWLVEYACRDDYGSLLEETSAWAGLFYFASRVDRPGEESAPVLTWPEGNGRIVAHLTRSAETRTGWLVTSIDPEDEGVSVVAIRGDEAVGIRARRVVFAGPRFVAPYVVVPWRDDADRRAAAFEYGSWAVANVHLRGRPASTGFPLAWDNVLYDSPSLGYVVATHQRGIDHGPTVLTWYYALCDADARAARLKLLAAGREEWAEVVLSDLERAHPGIRALTERIDVMRWGHAMVRPRPGFVWSESRRRAADPFRTIHFAHTDLSGLALVEEALDHGVRAAEEVLLALGREGGTWR